MLLMYNHTMKISEVLNKEHFNDLTTVALFHPQRKELLVTDGMVMFVIEQEDASVASSVGVIIEGEPQTKDKIYKLPRSLLVEYERESRKNKKLIELGKHIAIDVEKGQVVLWDGQETVPMSGEFEVEFTDFQTYERLLTVYQNAKKSLKEQYMLRVVLNPALLKKLITAFAPILSDPTIGKVPTNIILDFAIENPAEWTDESDAKTNKAVYVKPIAIANTQKNHLNGVLMPVRPDLGDDDWFKRLN